MSSFLDRMLLLALCFFYMLTQEIIMNIVISLLCAFSLCCISFYVSKRIIVYILWITYFTACFFYKPLFFFIPLAAYDLPQKKTGVIIGSCIVLIYATYAYFNFIQFILVDVMCISAYILSYKTQNIEKSKADIFAHRDAQEEFKRVMEEKQRYLIENKEYEIHVATLRERNRIAREIHDTVGHVLSRSILMVGALISTLKDEEIRKPLADLKLTLSSAMDTIRKSVHDLHDDAIDLKTAALSLIKEFRFCPVVLDYDISSTVEKDVKVCFLAIISEGLSNIAKHSNADSAAVHLWEHPALFQLCIEDNGKFQAGTVEKRLSSSQGIGLENMGERVKALGGTIYFSHEKGFKIFVSVPRGKE